VSPGSWCFCSFHIPRDLLCVPWSFLPYLLFFSLSLSPLCQMFGNLLQHRLRCCCFINIFVQHPFSSTHRCSNLDRYDLFALIFVFGSISLIKAKNSRGGVYMSSFFHTHTHTHMHLFVFRRIYPEKFAPRKMCSRSMFILLLCLALVAWVFFVMIVSQMSKAFQRPSIA
jgi:hypothetical protein